MSKMNPMPMAPFTFVGPIRHGDHFELRVKELPDFFLAAETIEEVYGELRGALGAFLATYVIRGEPLPTVNTESWVILAPTPDATRAQPFELSKDTGPRSGGVVSAEPATMVGAVAA